MPRVDPRPGEAREEADIRPVVARQGAGVPLWLTASIAVLGAVLLFSILDGQRRARTAPATQVRTADGIQMPSALPPLYIGPDFAEIPPPPPPPPPPPNPSTPARLLQPSAPPAPPFVPQPPTVYSPPPAFIQPPPVPEPQTTATGRDVLVIDTTSGSGSLGNVGLTSEASAAPGGDTTAERSVDPIRTTRLGRRATIVPQGTLIPAVLETALDSTRPGQVRAVVSRDMKGFDGSQILIPRGSRLFGEYQADLKPGQNRAFVQWTRLVRPDGVSIAIESPATDRLGRAGVQGRVDNHFLERFGSALLQSTLNFGAGWAGRSIGGDSPVVVALPGSTQGSGTPLAGSQIQPTLRVDAGVTVSVFVSRDLEFPTGGARR